MRTRDMDGRKVRATFDIQAQRHRTRPPSTTAERTESLMALRAAVLGASSDVAEALFSDLRKPRELPHMRELARVVQYIDDAVEHLDDWMVPSYLPAGPDGTEAFVRYEPRGVCLLFGPWNFPFQLTLGPLVPVLAAGNTAIVKPNEMAPATSEVIARIIRSTFDPTDVAVFEGGVDRANELLALPVDHIFFTGSPAVGRTVMAAASRHLSTVTLELGGKCPAIIDASADVALAASQIARGKHHNSGQVCLAPDHVLVHESVRDEFVDAYLEWVRDHLYRGGVLDEARCSQIVNDRNFDRLKAYVEDAVARGARAVRAIPGETSSGSGRFLDPTLLLDVPGDARVMQEEIFGPVLPVLPFRSETDVVGQVRSGGKPLAMYVFSENRDWVDRVIATTSSGGVTVNGWGTQFQDQRLPFGGVGESGMGRYHGRHGFLELSNQRAVVRHPAISYGGLITHDDPRAAEGRSGGVRRRTEGLA